MHLRRQCTARVEELRAPAARANATAHKACQLWLSFRGAMIASEVVSAVDSELRENLMVRIARMTPPENCREFLKSFSVVEQL
jgi:hypothetical protein